MSGTVDAAFGMKPLEMWDGSPWNGATRHFVSETSNKIMHIGDPLARVVSDAEKTCGRYMAVDVLTGDDTTVTAVDDQILGVLLSHGGQFIRADSPVGTPAELIQSDAIHVPAASSPAYLLNVCCDNAVLYTIQANAALPNDYTDVGKNGRPITGTGSTVTGISAFVLGAAAISADASDHLLIVGLLDVPGNLVTDTYPLFNVLVNIGYFKPGGYDPILGTKGI